jgi:mRNA interferase RelE/StbE
MTVTIGCQPKHGVGREDGVAMRYAVAILPTAERDMKRMSPDVARRVLRKIQAMQDDLAGDVKRLVDFYPPYRLRTGDWRVLFDIRGDQILVQRVRHRSDTY